LKNLQAVRLDVTHPEDIAAVLETITKAGRGLYGLVNNAGIAIAGSIPDMMFEEYELAMSTFVKITARTRRTMPHDRLEGAMRRMKHSG
jgi:NAD(P)-dependent dehydrogenase (short-subunit alcohol dehydrogenase family)